MLIDLVSSLSRGLQLSCFVLFFWLLKMKSESESRSVVFHSLRPHGLYSPWNSPGQNTGMGSLSLLQGIFPTQVLLKKIANSLTLKTIPESGHLHFIDVSSSIMYFPFFLVKKSIKYFIYIQKKRWSDTIITHISGNIL